MAANFTVNRDQVIVASLRTIGYLGESQTPTTEDINNCAQALNLMIKAWTVEGLNLWYARTIQVPLVIGQVQYTLGPTGNVVTDRPLRILNAFIRSPAPILQDTQLDLLSRQEYMQLGNKNASTAVPTSVYYDPQLGNGVLSVYPAPQSNTFTIFLIVQAPPQDIANSTDVPEFPSEWFQALKWGLADELCDEYGVAPTKIQRITAKALMYKENMMSWSSDEQVSTYFSMEQR